MGQSDARVFRTAFPGPSRSSRTRSSAARRRAAEMGQNQSGFMPDGQQGDKKKKPEKKKWQPPAPPTRVGKKLKKKGLDGANRLPNVTPASKCLLRKLKLERVKDWLLMEEEFVGNQERIKPHTERAEEEKSKVDDLRGAPMSVGNLEVIMATNKIESLDPALLRPGRIDRKIEFPLPDVKTKRHIFGIHTGRMNLAEDVELESFIMAM